MAIPIGEELISDHWGSVASQIGASKELHPGDYGNYRVVDTGRGTRIVEHKPTNSSSGTGLPSVDEYIKAITDTLPAPPKPYSEVNPFYFDEEWANEYSMEMYSPYYTEILQDYMDDVNKTKTRMGDDKDRFLQEIESQKDYFIQTKQTDLDRLIRGIKLGYEGQGLYQSGFRRRDETEAQADYQSGMEDYLRQHEYRTTGTESEYGRGLEDIDTAAGRYERDVGREQTAAVAGQVGQLKSEAMDEYLLGMQQYYATPAWGSQV